MNKKIFYNGGLIVIFTLILIGISLLCLFVMSKMGEQNSIADIVSQILKWITVISSFVLLFIGLPLLIVGAIMKKPKKNRPISSDRYCPNCKKQIPLESRICPFCRRDFEKNQ